MPIIASIGAMTSRAWGEFKQAVSQVFYGSLWAWGNNNVGQLGNGSTSGNFTATILQLGTVPSTVTPMTTASSACFSIKSDGTLWAWGNNASGQLGIGNTITKSSPVQVGSLTNWKFISSKGANTFAIKTDGTLWAWGKNSNGSLGIGTTANASSPVQIGSSTWLTVSGGTNDDTAFGIKTNGTLWGWGYSGSITKSIPGYNTPQSNPVQIGSFTDWVQVSSGGGTAYGIRSGGDLYAWGYNGGGYYGDGTTTTQNAPTLVDAGYSDVAACQSGAVARKTNGTLWGWGSTPVNGQNSPNQTSYVTQIGTASDWNAPKTNYNTIFASKTDGSLWGWGDNGQGQFGVNISGATINTYSSPIQIGSLKIWDYGIGGDNSVFVDKSGTFFACGYGATGGVGRNAVSRSSPVQLGTQAGWATKGQTAPPFQAFSDVRYDGTLWAWGRNSYGSLGQNNTVNYSSPVQIGGLWSMSSTGAATLAIGNDGTLWSWGLNNQGQLGQGNTIWKSSPVQVGGDTTWTFVQAAYVSSLGLKQGYELWMWGGGASGQLGTGTTASASSPVQVGGSWISACTGYTHSAGIKVDGTLWAWGENADGQLGQNNTIYRSSPVQVGTATDWAQVTCGQGRTLAIKKNGTLWAFGWNGYSALGTNTTINYSSPVQIGALTNWALVSTNESATLAIKTDGTLWGWGTNTNAQLAQSNENLAYSSPVQIGSATDWTSVILQYRTGFAWKSLGALYDWGGSDFGQLGQNATTYGLYSSPIQIGADTTWATLAITEGSQGNAAIKKDGTLWTWGGNGSGQLAQNNTTDLNSPTQVGALTNWASAMGGNNHFLFLKTNGTLWACGSNYWGQIGQNNSGFDGIDYSSPVQIGSLTTWASLGADNQSSFAIKTDGTLWAWGLNDLGYLGLNDNQSRSSPVQVGALTNWKQVGKGHVSTSAVKTDGTLWTWGWQEYGQLGNNKDLTAGVSSPVQVGTGTNWAYVSGGYNNNTAIKTDGTLWVWGINDSGQLATGNTTSYSSPVQVGALTNWKYSYMGTANSYFIKTDGTLWSCGLNNVGQGGVNTVVSNSSPVQVGSLTTWFTSQGGSQFATALQKYP